MDAIWPSGDGERERARQAALDAMELLDTPPEPAFDRLTEMASILIGAPIALMSLVDRDRQWFKSAIGFDVRETHRPLSFCHHAIRRDDIMIVEDASIDPRFRDNPLVVGEPGIRFYAGAQLRSSDGHAIGTLCVIDRRPRALSDRDRTLLRHLAAIAMDEIALRGSRRSLERHVRDLALAQASRNSFFSLVSHEMRTPLNAVMGFAELISGEIAGPVGNPKYLRYAEHIQSGAAKLLEFVEGVIELAAMERAHVAANARPIALAGELQAVVDSLKARATAKGVALSALSEPGLPELVADRRAVRQIIERLTANAVNFTPPGGAVRLSAGWDADAREFVLAVMDTGEGIAPDRLPALNRAILDAPFPTAPFGPDSILGMGLAIVGRLIHVHDGRCEISSEPGRGTVVTIRLPREPREREEAKGDSVTAV